MNPSRPAIRAVFDCMVFLQAAARRESPAGACLLLVEFGAIELCLSREIVAEVRDVLGRERLRRKFPALTAEFVDSFLTALEKQSRLVPDVPRIFPYSRDPKDESYLNLALAAGANYLVSRDSDLLDLARQSDADGERLRLQAPRLRVLDPAAFLAEMRRLRASG